MNIESLKKGDFFKLKESAKEVWVKDEYNRHTKRYTAHSFDDVCKFKELKKATNVFIDFEF